MSEKEHTGPSTESSTQTAGSCSIHLSELITKVRKYQSEKDSKLRRAIERHAAQLALQDVRQRDEKVGFKISANANKAIDMVLESVLRRKIKITRTDLRRRLEELRIQALEEEAAIEEEAPIEEDDPDGSLKQSRINYRVEARLTPCALYRSKEFDALTFHVLGRYEGEAKIRLRTSLAHRAGNAYSLPTVWDYLAKEVVLRCESVVDEGWLRGYAVGVIGDGHSTDEGVREIARIHNRGDTIPLLRGIWGCYPAQAREMGLPLLDDDLPPLSNPAAATAIERGALNTRRHGDESSYSEKPGASADTAEEPLAIDDEDHEILRFLDNQHPRLQTLVDIEAGASVTRKTAGERLTRLIGQGLAIRPKGPNGGAIITSKGVTLVASCKPTAQ